MEVEWLVQHVKGDKEWEDLSPEKEGWVLHTSFVLDFTEGMVENGVRVWRRENDSTGNAPEVRGV